MSRGDRITLLQLLRGMKEALNFNINDNIKEAILKAIFNKIHKRKIKAKQLQCAIKKSTIEVIISFSDIKFENIITTFSMKVNVMNKLLSQNHIIKNTKALHKTSLSNINNFR